MKIFLAATSHIHTAIDKTSSPLFLLESFLDLKSGTKKKEEYIKWCLSGKDFLLDSGAYAFMSKTKFCENFDFSTLDKYVGDYIDFINKWDIQHFFEMDLDNIVGYKKVLEYRKLIESKTNKKVIPVWHLSRGIEEFHKMCQEYNYVAIGGMAAKEITDKKLILDLCKIAHNYGCLVHGLGYMSLKDLNDEVCPFDTIDGTSWQAHIRGQEYYLENNKILKTKVNKYWKEVANTNYETWKKYGEWYDTKF